MMVASVLSNMENSTPAEKKRVNMTGNVECMTRESEYKIGEAEVSAPLGGKWEG